MHSIFECCVLPDKKKNYLFLGSDPHDPSLLTVKLHDFYRKKKGSEVWQNLIRLLCLSNYHNAQLKVFLKFHCPCFHSKQPTTWHWGFQRKLHGKTAAWLRTVLSTPVQQQRAALRLPLSSQNRSSLFFSSQGEDKLLFQKKKEFVAATYKLMGLIQSGTASSHAGAAMEAVSNESRNETSQKKDRFPELWAAGKIYLSKMHGFLHFIQTCYFKMLNHRWETLGYMGSSQSQRRFYLKQIHQLALSWAAPCCGGRKYKEYF